MDDREPRTDERKRTNLTHRLLSQGWHEDRQVGGGGEAVAVVAANKDKNTL